MTHKDRVMKFLNEYGSITSWEAIQEFGNTRLSATIYSIRESGVEIISEDESAINRFGDETTFTRYYTKVLHDKLFGLKNIVYDNLTLEDSLF